MWILKTLKIFWITLNKDLSFRYPPSKLDFSTLYTTLPHDKLKTRLKEKKITKLSVIETMAQNLWCWATIPHIFQTKLKKVKHATPRNK
jgi:hypothetical protein